MRPKADFSHDKLTDIFLKSTQLDLGGEILPGDAGMFQGRRAQRC